MIFSLLAAFFAAYNPHCLSCSENAFDEKEQEETSGIKVFISFSVPLETWRDFSNQMEKIGGVFILRGIPGNSFETLAEEILTLRKEGIYAPIDIDPNAFELYRIHSVPTILLEDGKRYDKVIGNVRLDTALQMMADQGDLPQMAHERLKGFR